MMYISFELESTQIIKRRIISKMQEIARQFLFYLGKDWQSFSFLTEVILNSFLKKFIEILLSAFSRR